MANLNTQIQLVQGSPTLALNETARQLRQQGKNVIHFAAGEPLNEFPECAREYLIKRISSGRVKYGPIGGMKELKQEVIDYTKKHYGKTPAQKNVMITIGAKQALYNLFHCLLDPEEEVLLLAPYWVSYPEMIKLAYGRPVIIMPDQQLVPTIEAITAAVTPKTKALILNNPNNPSGVVYPEEFVAKLVDYCETHQIYLILDDIYHQLMAETHHWVPGYVFTSEKIDSSHLIVINGISKSFGMTGFRIGWIIAPAEIIQAMQKIQGHSTSGASILLQEAALGALRAGEDATRELDQFIATNRRKILSALKEIPGVRIVEPGGTFYCFPDFSAFEADSRQLATRILQEAYVSSVPGIAFGLEGHLRLSYAGPTDQIQEGVDRIRWVIDPDAPKELTIDGEKRLCTWQRTRQG